MFRRALSLVIVCAVLVAAGLSAQTKVDPAKPVTMTDRTGPRILGAVHRGR